MSKNAISEVASAVQAHLRAASSRFFEHNAVSLVCGQGDADSLGRVPASLREQLAGMLETRKECLRQSWQAWRVECDEANTLFIDLLQRCGVSTEPTSGGLCSFTVPESGFSRKRHTFTTEGIDSIHVDAGGNFSATVKMVKDRTHWTETLAYNDGKLEFMPD